MRSPTRLLILLAAGAALAAPAVASAAPTSTGGVVVQRDARAGALVIATPSGALRRVKMAKLARFSLGTRISVHGAAVSVVGHARTAKLHGVVVHRGRHAFSLAGNGSVLAIASASPPASGQQVTTTVDVTPTALSDDDNDLQVDDDRAPSAELRGTVLSQTTTTLTLAVTGFPAGLPIALGTTTIPMLAMGTAVEAHVTLAADPGNPAAIVLTLVSLRLDDGNQHGRCDHHHGDRFKVDGQVTALTEATDVAPGSITIDGEQGAVTFAIPAGFGPSGVMVGDDVEAKGVAGATATDPPVLVRLESQNSDDESGDGGSGDSQNSQSGAGAGEGDDSHGGSSSND
jgi:uncharacterized membrane protein YgcG